MRETFCVNLPAWADKEICEKVKERDKLYKKGKNNQKKFTEYKQLCNEIQRLLKQKKKNISRTNSSNSK